MEEASQTTEFGNAFLFPEFALISTIIFYFEPLKFTEPVVVYKDKHADVIGCDHTPGLFVR